MKSKKVEEIPDIYWKTKVYLDNNFLSNPSLEVIAKDVFSSKYYLNHIFSKHHQEPPIQYVKRLRLQRSAFFLRFTENTILDIAFDNGYETGESFARAFRKQFAHSPKKYRTLFRMKNHQAYPLKTYASIKSVKTVFLSKPLRYLPIREYDKYNYLPHPATLPLNKEESSQLIGVSHDDPVCTPKSKIRFQYGLLLEKQTASVPLYTIEKGKFLYVLFKGSTAEIPSIYDYIYHTLLPKENLQIRSLPAYEYYKKFKNFTVEAEINVPIA
ncbi:MAG: helix-turn-helix domain-containing protein [Thermonemataceae bacterium]